MGQLCCWGLQAEMNRLTQLADILGMSQIEVAAVHGDLAEQAYKSQVGDSTARNTHQRVKLQCRQLSWT